MSDEAIQNQFYQLCWRFKKGEVYAMRIAACHLFADVYGKLNSEKRELARKKYAKLSKDDTPMVRWGVAQSMSVLANQLEPALVYEYLLPILKLLMVDKNDSVRVHAVSAAVTVASLLADPQTISTDIVPQLKMAYTNKQAWRLRFAVAEHSAQISKHMKREQVDQFIVPIYTALMNDSEPEVRSEAVNRLAELAEYCSG